MPNIDSKQAILLWARAGGMCSFRDRFRRCQRRLTQDPTNKDPAVITGEKCHMIPFKEPHQRKSEEILDPEKLNSYENLILLCGDHHDVIDKQPRRYTTKKLRKMKEWHEYWVEKFQKKKLNPVILKHKIMYNSFLYALSIYIIAGFVVLFSKIRTSTSFYSNISMLLISILYTLSIMLIYINGKRKYILKGQGKLKLSEKMDFIKGIFIVIIFYIVFFPMYFFSIILRISSVYFYLIIAEIIGFPILVICFLVGFKKFFPIDDFSLIR